MREWGLSRGMLFDCLDEMSGRGGLKLSVLPARNKKPNQIKKGA